MVHLGKSSPAPLNTPVPTFPTVLTANPQNGLSKTIAQRREKLWLNRKGEGPQIRLQPGDPLCSTFDRLNRTQRHAKLFTWLHITHIYKEGEEGDGGGARGVRADTNTQRAPLNGGGGGPVGCGWQVHTSARFFTRFTEPLRLRVVMTRSVFERVCVCVCVCF